MADPTSTPVVLLSRERILNASDRKMELVAVPEWGGSLYVRGITGRERDQFEASMTTQKRGDMTLNLRNVRAKLVILAACDSDGTALFNDDDILALGAKSSAALERVFAVAQRLAGMTKGDIEELAGNSETVPSDGSISD